MSGVGTTLTVAPVGIGGELVRVEAHRSSGLPSFQVVGLPDAALRESKQRVRAAISSAGLPWAEQRYTVNLSPADLPKSGSGFDLAIAAALLASQSGREIEEMDRRVHIGELGLDGSARPVRGILPMVAAARDAGITEVVVPARCVKEAALVGGIKVIAVADLAELAALYALGEGRSSPPYAPPSRPVETPSTSAPDLADVRGQSEARYGLEVAAAGGHHVFFLGEPGTGKTMLAQRLPTILPLLTDDDAVTVTSIHSLIAHHGLDELIRTPPWVAPHHSATMPAMVGGGSGLVRPGAVSLAHAGVLFLDEAPEFAPSVLDALRQPLESGRIQIQRARAVTDYPARFQLVMAANPCPCGAATHSAECRCTPYQRQRYLQRLSGPLMDRIDITCLVERPSARELSSDEPAESSQCVRERVEEARRRAAHRWKDESWNLNSQVPGSYLHRSSLVPPHLRRRIISLLTQGRISMRGIDRMLRVALSIADLAGDERVSEEHLARAYTLRTTESHHDVW
ncbi:MAG: YifB family Mg chelatase-like AAA ATPase [Actinomycetaceae bacterium]|nr:YifB family Mg chelatase-like AAA ATPase [Actinomycetaceae bacterium]